MKLFTLITLVSILLAPLAPAWAQRTLTPTVTYQYVPAHTLCTVQPRDSSWAPVGFTTPLLPGYYKIKATRQDSKSLGVAFMRVISEQQAMNWYQPATDTIPGPQKKNPCDELEESKKNLERQRTELKNLERQRTELKNKSGLISFIDDLLFNPPTPKDIAAEIEDKEAAIKKLTSDIERLKQECAEYVPPPEPKKKEPEPPAKPPAPPAPPSRVALPLLPASPTKPTSVTTQGPCKVTQLPSQHNLYRNGSFDYTTNFIFPGTPTPTILTVRTYNKPLPIASGSETPPCCIYLTLGALNETFQTIFLTPKKQFTITDVTQDGDRSLEISSTSWGSEVTIKNFIHNKKEGNFMRATIKVCPNEPTTSSGVSVGK